MLAALAVFFVFHVKHYEVFGWGRGCPGYFATNILFFIEEKLIIIVSHETIAVLMIIDASWLLQ